MFKAVLIGVVVMLVCGFAFLETYTPAISANHGMVHAELFLGEHFKS